METYYLVRRAYHRLTQECVFDELRPELRAALRQYAEKHELDDPQAQAILWSQTTRELLKKPGLLGRLGGGGGDPIRYTAMVIAPPRMFWGRSSAKSGAAVLTRASKNLEGRDFSSPLGQDSGLEVAGSSGGPERSTALIGLSPEPAAQKFRQAGG